MNSKATCREKRGETAHLQSRRRSLQPMSDIHLSVPQGVEQRVPASFQCLSPGISSVVTGCSLIWIFVFSDSDTTRLTAALSTAKKKPLRHFRFNFQNKKNRLDNEVLAL